MPITIGSNITSLKAQRRLNESTSTLARTKERLASGMRINRASDDAAGLAIASALNANARIYNQAVRNITDGQSVTSIAHSAVQELKRITERQLELATFSANGIYSAKQREAIEEEARRLTEAYNTTVLTTEFNGRDLFSESWGSLDIQAGVGEGSVISLKLGAEMATTYEPGSYFLIGSGSNEYAAYFNIDGVGSGPSLPGVTNLQVSLSTTAQKESTQYVFQDPSSLYDGASLYIGLPDGTYSYIWFDTDGDSNGDPEYGEASIRVDVSGVSTADGVADQVQAALQGLGHFDVQKTATATLVATAVDVGTVADAFDNDSSTAVTILSQGHSVNASMEGVRDAVATALSNTGRFTTAISADGNLIVTSTTAGRSIVRDYNSGVGVEMLTESAGLVTYAGGGTWPTVATGDLNNDGWLDYVTAAGTASVRLNQQDGTFAPAVNYSMGPSGYVQDINIVDINGDGKLDLLTANWLGNAIGIRYGNGDGTFLNATTFGVGSWAVGVTTADIDNDGDLDIGVAVGGSGTIRIIENQGSGTLALKNSYAGVGNNSTMTFADFNKDGFVDYLAVGSTGPYVRLNNGNGTFGAATTYTPSSSTGGVNAGDLNRDGWVDMVMSSGSNFVVRLNNGSGGLGAESVYSVGGSTGKIVLKDLNGDGALDIAAANSTSGTVSVRLNNGNGTFGAITSYAIASGAYGVSTGDFDNDNSLDLISVGGSGVGIRFGADGGGFESNVQQVVQLVFGDARGRVTVNQIDLASIEGARAALDTLAARMQRLAAEESMIGALESRLHVALSVVKSRSLNYEGAASRILDADIAAESSELIRATILQEASAALLAQANQQPALALRLLQPR